MLLCQKQKTFFENEVYFFHPDHLGSSTVITDGSGYAYQIFLNLPFGETMAEQRRSGTFNNVFKFNGKELDTETGLYYYGARYYDPRLSVWLSVDPLAEQAPGWSPYNYTFNNPIIFTDPDGRWPWSTKNDPWVKGAGFFRNIFKNGSKIHAQNFADQVGGNVVEGAGWGYHVFYSSDDGYWKHKANFKKGSNSAKPESIHSFSASLQIEGHSLIMGNILDIPVDLAMYGIVQGAEILGMSEEDAAKMAGVLIVINDLKGLKVNKIIRNADDLIQAAGKFSNKPRGKVGENTIQGNVDDIFNTITTEGFKRESGAIEMPNGTIINKHSSQNGNTIDIRLPGESKNHKIRIED